MDNPLVSVIIPTYSRPVFLERAIESVLSQSYKNIEIIIVDDNGENTENQIQTENIVLKRFRLPNLFYIKHKVNRNGCVARNTGLNKSQGDYITFLDDDDFMFPNRIESCVNVLEENRDYDICYSSFERRTENSIRSVSLAEKSGDLLLDLLKLNWRFGTGSNPFFRRVVYEEIGGFNEKLIRKQDVEYMCRALNNRKILAITDVLIVKYIDSDSNRPNMRKYEQVLEIFLLSIKDLIGKYPSRIKKEIYRNQWFEISILALNYRDKVFFKYLIKSCKEGSLSIKQILRLVKALLFPSIER